MDQLSLFNADESYRFPESLLEYKEDFLTGMDAGNLMENLIANSPWQQTSIRIFDKVLQTPRLIAWYGDTDKPYQLASQQLKLSPWTSELKDLKDRVEEYSGHHFNSVLLNYYRDGNDSVAWHRDKESELGTRPVIASLSLGQVRSFEFRSVEDYNIRYSLPLKSGSLLIMKGDLQVYWEHRIAKSKKAMKPRVNLTFRQINGK